MSFINQKINGCVASKVSALEKQEEQSINLSITNNLLDNQFEDVLKDEKKRPTGVQEETKTIKTTNEITDFNLANTPLIQKAVYAQLPIKLTQLTEFYPEGRTKTEEESITGVRSKGGCYGTGGISAIQFGY